MSLPSIQPEQLPPGSKIPGARRNPLISLHGLKDLAKPLHPQQTLPRQAAQNNCIQAAPRWPQRAQQPEGIFQVRLREFAETLHISHAEFRELQSCLM